MKTRFTFVLLLVCFFGATLTAQNLLNDSGFDQSSNIEKTDVSNKNTESGKWLAFLAKNQTGFDVDIQSDNVQGPVALLHTTTQKTWYRHYLMQRLDKTPEKAVYRLSFKAKAGKNNAVLSSQIILTDGNGNKFYAIRDGFDESKSTHSGATSDVKLSKDWKTYELDFDLSQMCNNVNSPKSLGDKFQLVDTSDNALEDVRVTIQAYKSAPARVFIDDVKFEKVK